MKEGILYSLFGTKKKLWEELEVSLTSLKKTNPGIKVCLVTNNPQIPGGIRSRFDSVVQLAEDLHFFKLKVLAFLHTPFQKTVFLDLDTQVKGSLEELFEFLRYYDVAVAPDPLCDWEKEDYFVDYFNLKNLNTGVLAYQKNEVTDAFIRHWLASFIDQDDADFLKVEGRYDDQDFFNKAVVEERENARFGLKLLILPNTVYNARPWIWKNMKDEKIRQRIKVLHAHNLPGSNLVAIKRKVQFRLKKLLR